MPAPWLTFDIETYSELDLTKVGAYVYSRHHSFEVLMITWKYCGGPIRSWSCFGAGNATLEEFRRYYHDPEVELVAQSAQFERTCLSSPHILSALKIDRPSMSRWRCTAALALFNGLPKSLDSIGSVLDLPIKKDPEGKRLIKLLTQPRKPTKKDGRRRIMPDAGDPRWLRFLEYCCTDTEVEELVWMHPVMRMPSAQWWSDYHLHEEINDRGVRVDVSSVRNMLRMISVARIPIERECAKITGGITASQVAGLSEWLRDRLLDVENLDKDSVQQALAGPLTNDVRRVLELRLEFAKASVSKYESLERTVAADHRVRGMQVYHGAHTGRPTGQLVQLYNFPRATEKHADEVKAAVRAWTTDLTAPLPDKPLALASRMLRPMLVPADGMQFLIVDYNAIEARGVGWLADDPIYMQEYRGAGKLYERTAAGVYGVRPDEILKDTPQRFLGKTIVLGCGYQMGKDKFVLTAQTQAREQGLPPFDEVVLRRAHRLFRANHQNGVVSLWYAVQHAAMNAIRDPRRTYGVADGRLQFGMRGDALLMRLPSGRTLTYRNAGVVQRTAPWDLDKPKELRGPPVDQIVYHSWRKNGWREVYTYGGKLTENAVQGLCNDLLRHAMHTCSRYALFKRMVLHVYDELVVEVPNHDATQEHLRKLEALMCQTPSWAADFPMAAEGKISPYYTK